MHNIFRFFGKIPGIFVLIASIVPIVALVEEDYINFFVATILIVIVGVSLYKRWRKQNMIGL
ncbi:MAG: LPXTG cell wall anchor domain-containing protein [Patescibacteria group bacterium]